MPPVIYTCYCKLCQYRRGGTFDIVADSIDTHLQRTHKIVWRDSEGDTFRDFTKKIKRLIPSLKGEDGVVEVSVEGATVVYDKMEKAWSIITPLFEISSAGHRITEEEWREAKKVAEALKERRRIVEREWKRIKYKRKYNHYHLKYYEQHLKNESLHMYQNLSTETNIEHAKFMQLWCEYHSLKITSEDTPEFYKTSKELKKHRLHTQPLGKKDLEELRINYSLLCRKCPLKPICGLSRSARSLSREILVEEGCVLLQKLFAPSP